MASRSTIALKFKDGSYKQIYCHWDGEPEKNGRLLMDHYNNQDRIEELLQLGDLSKLGKFLSIDEKNSVDSAVVCEAYRRDYGYTGVGPLEFKDDRHFIHTSMHEEFNYLFVDGEWKVNGFFLKNILE